MATNPSHRRRRCLQRVFAASLAALLQDSKAAPTKAPVAPDGQQLHALLVGVSHSPALPDVPKLAGVAADIDAMTILARRLGAPPHQITVLSDASPNAISPTLTNILTSLNALEAQANERMRALIYLGGHGSQQPIRTTPSASGNETDGLDEIFLTSDAQAYNPATGMTPNALTDNMLAAVLQNMAAKGAQVWLVVDSCHAGTFSRAGIPDSPTPGPYRIVGYRGVSPSALGVPTTSAAWTRLVARGNVMRRQLPVLFATAGPDNASPAPWRNLTAFYATPAAGLAVEVKAADSGPVLGLFTLFLTEEAHRLLSTPGIETVMAYRLLMQRVLARYRKHAPPGSPLPTFEVADQNTWFARPTR